MERFYRARGSGLGALGSRLSALGSGETVHLGSTFPSAIARTDERVQSQPDHPGAAGGRARRVFRSRRARGVVARQAIALRGPPAWWGRGRIDLKSTRLNSRHTDITP